MALDFSGQNLRGRNFKDRQDLAGANFSYADIQGANFTNANLKGANFTGVKAGLQYRWVTGLAISSLILSTLLAFFASLAGVLGGGTLVAVKIPHLSSVVIILITLLIISIITKRQGLADGGLVALSLIVIATAAWLWLTTIQRPRYITYSITQSVAWVAVSIAWAAAGTIFEATFSAVCGTAFSAVLGKMPWDKSNEESRNEFSAVFGTVFGAAIIIVAWANIGTIFVNNNFGNLFGAMAVLIIGGTLGVDISLQALANEQKYAWIIKRAIFFAAIKGTSFYGADLTNADFTQATVKSTDFQNAILTCTCWHQVKMLDLVRPGWTYLQNPQVRQLLVTRQRQDKNFDRQNLRGVNLQAANLADASFIGTDLNEANLQDANLSRAKLKQTQLDGTDLTGATLTGAYIEDWGITNTTKLHGVRCEYVFMRLPTKEDPDPLRKPDNKQEVFVDGDFADFIQPIFDTLDLYHNQGVDPRAIAIAFKNLTENHPEAELEIVAMEKRGDDKILLRAKTAAGSDKSQLSGEYFDDYNQLKVLSQSQQLLLIEKDSYISDLKNMITTALQQPKSYTQGNTIMSDISGINIQGSSNVSGIAGGGSVANLGTISGNVNIALNQLPDATDAEKPGIKELLTQLHEVISQSSDLPETDKADALLQVEALAEAGKNPQESTKQKTAKNAITMLKGLFSGLPAIASLVEATNKLLPAIAKLFGLG